MTGIRRGHWGDQGVEGSPECKFNHPVTPQYHLLNKQPEICDAELLLFILANDGNDDKTTHLTDVG